MSGRRLKGRHPPLLWLFCSCMSLMCASAFLGPPIRRPLSSPSAVGTQPVRPLQAISEASYDVQHFWSNLPGAELQNNGQVLALTNDTFFMGDYDLGDHLYVRKSYDGLYADINSAIGEGRARRVLITGTPGIGKSFYAFYWLWKLSQLKQTVIYQLDDMFYRFTSENVVTGRWEDFFGAKYFEDRDVWFLSDPIGSLEAHCKGVTLAFMSPKVPLYEHFIKRAGAVLRYMPVWSEQELLECGAHLFGHLSPELISQRYREWGGVPRFVLQFATEPSQQRRLLQAINMTHDFRALISSAGEGFGNTDETSDMLLHMVTTSYTDYQLCWASNYVKRKVGKIGRSELLRSQLSEA